MKRTFIFQEGNSQKFWETELKGKEFTVTYGKLGTKGRSLTKSFETKEKCQKEADKLIAEKTKKGYKESSEGTEASGKVVAKKPAAKKAVKKPAVKKAAAKKTAVKKVAAKKPAAKKAVAKKTGEYDSSAIFYKLELDKKYQDAWYSDEKEHFEEEYCPVFSSHTIAERNDENLSILVKGKRIGDFVFTTFDDLLITDKTAQIFKKHRLTGYKLREVEVANKELPFKLWQLIVVGKAKLHPDVGVKEVYRCEHCNYVRRFAYNDDEGVKIAENSWDGSDFFETEEYCINLISEKVKKIIDDHELKGALLIPGVDFRYSNLDILYNRKWTAKQWKKYFETD
jgi:predicted DNA-binding WGR domain protein